MHRTDDNASSVDASAEPTGQLSTGAGLYVDEKTGERFNLVVQARDRDVVDRSLGGWFVSWQEASVLLAKDKRMNLTDHRVLLACQGVLDFDNYIKLSLSELGELIDVDRSDVGKSLRKLVEYGFLTVGPTSKNTKTYRLNPSLAYKGALAAAAKQRRAALKVIQGGKGKSKTATSQVNDEGAEHQLDMPF